MKVVNDVPVVEVLYDIENSFVAVLVSAMLRFWLMTCTSLSYVYLCQILFSFQDVYEFPTVQGIEMFTVCL